MDDEGREGGLEEEVVDEMEVVVVVVEMGGGGGEGGERGLCMYMQGRKYKREEACKDP